MSERNIRDQKTDTMELCRESNNLKFQKFSDQILFFRLSRAFGLYLGVATEIWQFDSIGSSTLHGNTHKENGPP
jgi:hypothetical protein